MPVAKALGAREVISVDNTPMSKWLNLFQPRMWQVIFWCLAEEEFSTDAENFAKTVLKELQLKGEVFDFIIVTRNEKYVPECDSLANCGSIIVIFDSLNWESLKNFCAEEGKMLSTLPEKLSSDSYGFLERFIFSTYIRLKFLIEVSKKNYQTSRIK